MFWLGEDSIRERFTEKRKIDLFVVFLKKIGLPLKISFIKVWFLISLGSETYAIRE